MRQVTDPQSRNALEAALCLAKGPDCEPGRVAVLSMGPADTRDRLTEAMAMGADEAYLLSDAAFGGADTLATSYTLAAGVRKIEEASGCAFDLILGGTSSSDGGTSHVLVQTAQWLERTHISNVCSISEERGKIRAVKRSEEVMLCFEGDKPACLAVTRDINKPRLVTAMGIIKARKKPLTVWDADDLGVDRSLTGLAGSPTRGGKLLPAEQGRAASQPWETPEEAAAGILRIIRKAGL